MTLAEILATIPSRLENSDTPLEFVSLSVRNYGYTMMVRYPNGDEGYSTGMIDFPVAIGCWGAMRAPGAAPITYSAH